MEEIAVGPLVGQLALETMLLFGSVITHVTAPVGCTAPAIPVMVVVKVTGLLSVGLDDATKVMTGALADKVKVSWLLEAAM